MLKYLIILLIALDDALFAKLKKSAVAPYLKAVKELNVDFIGILLYFSSHNH